MPDCGTFHPYSGTRFFRPGFCVSIRMIFCQVLRDRLAPGRSEQQSRERDTSTLPRSRCGECRVA